jgi:hypothetical protein
LHFHVRSNRPFAFLDLVIQRPSNVCRYLKEIAIPFHSKVITSVTLIHPEESLTIPVHQAISKCSLFQKNPTLTISPYRIQSSVSLSIFHEFISALEGNSVNITVINIDGLNRLCEESGFTEFSSKLCRFSEGSECSSDRQIGSLFNRMRSGFLRESFEFIVNGSVIESENCRCNVTFSKNSRATFG